MNHPRERVDYMKNDTKLYLLEQTVININDNLSKIDKRFDIIEQKIDTKFLNIDNSIQKTATHIEKKIEKLEENAKKVDGRLWTNFYWILGAMFSLSCAGATLLAKGFHWFN